MNIKEDIKNLLENYDLKDLNNNNFNELVNQIFITLHEINDKIEYKQVYSISLKLINEIENKEKEKIDKENKLDIINTFDMFENKLELINNLEEEHKKNLEFINNLKKEINYKKVKFLKSLYQPEQRTKEWYEIRKTLFTASSDVHEIVFRNKNSVIRKKCGYENSFKGNRYTWHGNKYEDIAIAIYEQRYNREVWEFGLLPHPKITVLGASPDGITTCGRMLEIKCPSGRKINGKIKPIYFTQMQTQMEVCDLEVCDFFECNIEEYKSYEEYKYDIYENDIDCLNILPIRLNKNFINLPSDRKTQYGLEKGMIGSYGDHPGNMKHIYPPFNLNSDGQYKWLQDKKKELKEQNIDLIIDFWKLQTSSLNIVKRDKEWWKKHNITQKLYNTWDLIEEARKEKNGIDKYLTDEQLDDKYNTGITLDLTNLNINININNNDINDISGLDNLLLTSSDDDEEEEKVIKKNIKKIKKVKIKKVKIIKKNN